MSLTAVNYETYLLNYLLLYNSSYVRKYIQFRYIKSSACTEGVILFVGQFNADGGNREHADKKQSADRWTEDCAELADAIRSDRAYFGIRNDGVFGHC